MRSCSVCVPLVAVPTDLHAGSSLGPHRYFLVFRRSYKHHGQGLPGAHEIVLDLCVVGGYT